ncbi:MAG: hypothetical protein HDS00_03355 [Bacteroides sp.]|nr:hypothetical protein [Bacteroides sp.]
MIKIRKNLVGISCIGILGIFAMAHKEFQKSELSDLQLQNIEALTNEEDEKGKGFRNMHFPVFDIYGNATGRCTATCYEYSASNSGCHKHGSKECCS